LGFSHIQYLLKHRPIGKFISIIVEINPDDDQRIAYATVNIALSIFRVPPKVRFGSKADMCSTEGHVRFTPESGHRLRYRGRRLRL
jgi:hypothetical protein